jgi:hypothetical protein
MTSKSLLHVSARAAVIIATLLAGTSAFAYTSTEEPITIAALQNIEPMTPPELASSVGGFILPNGLNINIGVETAITVNGALIVQTVMSSLPGWMTHNNNNSNSVTSTPANQPINTASNDTPNTPAITTPATPTTPSAPTIAAVLQSGGGVTQVMQLIDGQGTIINNTASNAIINQTRTINVDVANFANINTVALKGLQTLTSQAVFGLRNK